MDIIKLYGNIVKNSMKDSKHTLNLIRFGLSLEEKRSYILPDKQLPNSLKYLNQICLKFILEPLKKQNECAFVNLFAPTEILHSMNIYPLFVEAFSSFLSGLKCEDKFIDNEEKTGLGETLCSYHKAFLGALEYNILPKPLFSVTSSIICDANINTFRHAAYKYNIPLYTLDIPYKYSKDSEVYVVEQLKEMIDMIENITNKKLSQTNLKQVIHNENQSKIYMKKYFNELSTKYFPNTLTMEMYKLFTSHVSMGRCDTLNFYKKLYKDIKNIPSNTNSNTKRILWVHLLPFYHESLRKCFNFSDKYQILTCDLNFDYMDELDINNPLNSLAKKMILNQYNGSFQRKIDNIIKMCDILNVDGVISFCQWGCKQSSGGSMLLKRALKERNIPVLSIDGDGIDRRNSSSGQIQTRLDAFLEILNN
ncbi:2-hydroxyacyl-CoA dehydratase subunit D [Haloimpatiens sp. FM7330]|uniref:2-hydroxyacyl-CoA dehydratase subunit D n=1 Tax=Haloimpatiens sp. FM7330 TaxID=3298610 RepID=UPI00362B7370